MFASNRSPSRQLRTPKRSKGRRDGQRRFRSSPAEDVRRTDRSSARAVTWFVVVSVAVSAVVTGGAVVASSKHASAQITEDTATSSAVAGTLGELVNQARTGAGLPTLARDATLDAEAQAWASTIAARGVLEHSTLSRLRRLGYRSAAENIAHGPTDPAFLQSLFANSPPHLENQLNPRYTAMGIGVAFNGDTLWVAELFGAKASPNPARAALPTAGRNQRARASARPRVARSANRRAAIRTRSRSGRSIRSSSTQTRR